MAMAGPTMAAAARAGVAEDKVFKGQALRAGRA
jgi:hypothetical protein